MKVMSNNETIIAGSRKRFFELAGGDYRYSQATVREDGTHRAFVETNKMKRVIMKQASNGIEHKGLGRLLKAARN